MIPSAIHVIDTAHVVSQGPMWLALLVALAAGALSFASPCILPLVPGYLSYIAGALGGTSRNRSLAVRGTLLFVLGFSVEFTVYGAAFGSVGNLLQSHARQIEQVLGVVVIILGLAFMGQVRFLQRDSRPHSWTASGVWGAFLLGLVFGLGWSPCVGPTLAAVNSLAFAHASAWRGALLGFVFCLGLGIPFIVIATASDALTKQLAWMRKRTKWISRIGAAFLIAIGVMLVLGTWDSWIIEVQAWVSQHVPSWTPPW